MEMIFPRSGPTRRMKYCGKGGTRNFLLLLCLVFTAAATPRSARAAPDEQEVGEVEAEFPSPSEKEGTSAIPGLTFKKGPFPLTLIDPMGPAPQLVVTLEGAYSNLNWSLLAMPAGKVVPCSKIGGHFRIQVPILPERTSLAFTAVAPSGVVQSAQIVLNTQDWDEVKRSIHQTPPPRRLHWSLGAGMTHLDFTQGGITEISSFLISTQASLMYWLKPDVWNLVLSGYWTPLSLSTNPSSFSIQFLGMNARAGYVFPWITAPWRLTLMAGLYYATTFTSSQTGASFGYVNIGGPEIYPMLSRTFRSGSSVQTYFKFAPVSDQFTFLGLSNREIATGLSYNFPPDRARRNFSLTFDWANLTVQEGAIQASSTTISLGAGYRW
jgi:hypothetical protein